MNTKRPTERPPWQPRIDEEPELNPSVRSTVPGSGSGNDDRTLAEIEAQNEESEAREDDPEPIKVPER